MPRTGHIHSMRKLARGQATSRVRFPRDCSNHPCPAPIPDDAAITGPVWLSRVLSRKPAAQATQALRQRSRLSPDRYRAQLGDLPRQGERPRDRPCQPPRLQRQRPCARAYPRRSSPHPVLEPAKEPAHASCPPCFLIVAGLCRPRAITRPGTNSKSWAGIACRARTPRIRTGTDGRWRLDRAAEKKARLGF
jgi:hypothetical protein